MDVDAKISEAWLPAARIANLVQVEPILMTLGLVVGSVIFYKLFLRGLSTERHQNLSRQFRNTSFHLVIAAAEFAGYYALTRWAPDNTAIERLNAYLGFFCVIGWIVVFIKTSRILLFEYLFLSNMKTGVPLLLVNILTLILTLLLGGWITTEVFAIQIAPLLATSAIFSVVLGLALQDTLGNLFAGIAIQFDKTYAIGDWIEVTVNDLKWVGQVQEISWRATLLISLTEETISVPNRLMGQTQVSNFSTKHRPIIRSQMFRLPYGCDIERVKTILLDAAQGVNAICQTPGPSVLITETSDSFMSFKLIYFIRDYGAQLSIGDRMIRAGLNALQAAGIETAPSRILVLGKDLPKEKAI